MTSIGSLTEGAPEQQSVAVFPAAHRPSRRHLRAFGQWILAKHARQITAAISAVILVVAAGSFVAALAFPPDKPVRALFAALSARDASTAGRLAGCDSSPLCDGNALSAGYQPPVDLHIDRITSIRQRAYGIVHDDADIRLTYRLPGHLTPIDADITVLRSGGVGQNWTIGHGGYGTLAVVSASQATATVAAVSIPTVTTAPQEPNRSLQPALLGIYTITGSRSADGASSSHDEGGDSLLRSPPQQATIAGTDDPVVVTLHPTIAPEVQATIQRQVDASVDQCAARTHDILAVGCPFQPPNGHVSYHVGDDVTWTITGYPQIALTISADPDASGGPVTVTTTTPGHVIATWANGSEFDNIVVHGFVTADTNGEPNYHG